MALHVSLDEAKRLFGEAALEGARKPKKKKGKASEYVDNAETLAAILRVHAPDLYSRFRREYYCFDDSEHRTDFADTLSGVVLEVDGGRSKARGGRHATDEDYAKINKLIMLGWRVLRFTPTMLNRDPLGVVAIITQAIALPASHTLQRYGGKRPPASATGRRPATRKKRRGTG